ncbi:HupE/UreJ family protein [Labrys sp. LIt4]|uniref:HupE/UreJ family protein n=1 Tax=Labrys sp. LIt4 TaxID=2821355 RepID=UPI001ADF3498|nr:HupE/UreJ family protein [Labrys sp. LIt4]MBP0581264.1 HupE/UreJ family protein [Labrys sp. LIt4]
MKKYLIAFAAMLSATPAMAHINPAEHASFSTGFLHPLSGADHVLAMVAVGLWAAQLGGRALWAVPATFVLVMMAGFGASLTGMPLPFIEPAIAASVVVLGLLALTAFKVPMPMGMIVVGFFALFHGFAHGSELGEASATPFLVGFALATALLHAAGVLLGPAIARLAGDKAGRLVTRFAGGLTALAGLALMVGG